MTFITIMLEGGGPNNINEGGTVRELVKGREVFVSIPTGRDMSLCYGCLLLVFDCCFLHGQGFPQVPWWL